MIHTALIHKEHEAITNLDLDEIQTTQRKPKPQEMNLEIQKLKYQLDIASFEIDRLRSIEIEKTKLEIRVEMLQDQLNEAKVLQDENKDLLCEIGRLQGELDALRRQVDKDSE